MKFKNEMKDPIETYNGVQTEDFQLERSVALINCLNIWETKHC